MFNFDVRLLGRMQVTVIAESREEATRILKDTIDSITISDIKDKLSKSEIVEIKDSKIKEEIRTTKNKNIER